MGCGCSKVLPAGRPSVEELRKKFGADSSGQPDEDGLDAVPAAQFLRSGASLKGLLETNAVLVVVRVRPLSQKEKDKDKGNSKEAVKLINGQALTITPPAADPRQFSFDACFNADASQQDVYDRSGRMVLGKVLDGYNGCVFAYGQTGSGKTHTMQGTPDAPGVIPRLCSELFERVRGLAGKKHVEVHASMCEIYNERLNDLLSRSSGDEASSRDLKIREEEGPGGSRIYVDGLSEITVDSGDAVLALLADGAKRRAIGRTDMNEHSSRSHSVVTLRVEAWEEGDADKLTATSAKLHLIDLAGSERQKGTGATGERLKEGASINVSLSALGNVISALSEKKTRHVPYRDSKLTRLLQDSLGGNSVTVMLCNASPAAVNVDETLSALRFAERAKKIQNVATINRDPKAGRAAALYEENKELRAKVTRLQEHIAELEKWYK
mmetsp:Transcript_4170/g.10011  ORF Transcript_4170/g.10011 Transcript_4170/m.10011 type:complete len:439 (+) Transcript_4170:192-1508(+)